MKKLIPLSLICLLLVGVSNLQAQTKDDPWGFTTRFGFASYNGDLGNSLLEYGEDTDPAFGVGLSYYISNNFDIALEFSTLALEKLNPVNDPVYAQRTTFFETNIVNLNLLMRWKFLNTFMEGRDSEINPYLAAGLGLGYLSFAEGGRYGCSNCSNTGGPLPENFATPVDPSDFVFSIPFGAGVSYELSDGLQLNIQAIYNRSFSDDIDQFPSGAGEEKDNVPQPLPRFSDVGENGLDDADHDDWFTTTVGLMWTFGGPEGDKNMMKQRMLESLQNIEDDVDDINDDIDELIELNEETIDALNELQEDLQMSDNQMEELRGKFERIINNIQFAFDESYIIEPAYDELESLVGVLETYQGLNVHLEAYADRRGSVEYNRELARARAQSVKDFLTERGISPSRIAIDIYGERKAVYEPPSKADAPTVWAQNRAVQVTLSYNAM